VVARLGAAPTTTLAEAKQAPTGDAKPHVHAMPHLPHPEHRAPPKRRSGRLAALRNGHDYGHDADMDAIFGDESSRGPQPLAASLGLAVSIRHALDPAAQSASALYLRIV
jgi:hypothetical protein